MIGIILGSGLGKFDEEVENPTITYYKNIAGFPPCCSAPGHKGRIVVGKVCGKDVAVMSGRFHAYEGYSTYDLQRPIKYLKEIGCDKIVLTNAAGGVNINYKPGDIVLLKDQIKLCGIPLAYGSDFFDTSNMYTKSLREKALEVGKNSNLTIHEGVYFYMPGPNYETPAEIRAIRLLGGDVVGMSTVFEAAMAAKLNMQVLGISVVSNMAAGVTNNKITSDEVQETTGAISDKFISYMKELIKII